MARKTAGRVSRRSMNRAKRSPIETAYRSQRFTKLPGQRSIPTRWISTYCRVSVVEWHALSAAKGVGSCLFITPFAALRACHTSSIAQFSPRPRTNVSKASTASQADIASTMAVTATSGQFLCSMKLLS